MTDARLLQDTVDHLAINRLQSAYADTVTRRDWTTLEELFLDDAVVEINTVTRDPFRVVGPQALGEFIASAVGRFDFFEFVVLNSLVTLGVEGDSDAASARMFMCEVRRNASDQEWSMTYGLYQDRYRRIDGRWWFTARVYRSLARTGADGGAFPFPNLPATP